jgi:hypothetical protein
MTDNKPYQPVDLDLDILMADKAMGWTKPEDPDATADTSEVWYWVYTGTRRNPRPPRLLRGEPYGGYDEDVGQSWWSHSYTHWSPSTTLADAMEVVEHLHKEGNGIQWIMLTLICEGNPERTYQCTILDHNLDYCAIANAPTLPLAICQTVQKWVEVRGRREQGA